MSPTVPDPPGLAAARADPRRRFGSYVLLSELGRGGMGVVYKAWDEPARRLVALKVLPSEAATPEAMRRFEREAEALARVGHPGIVPIHAAGALGGKQFLAMALMPGGTFKARLAARGPDALTLGRRVAIVAEVARAVHAAHSQGIVHRDLKPENVLLDADDRPYVADFGLARFVDGGKSRLTQSNAAVGTASFMAPEQIDGGAVDARADVYSLGATLYFALTGRAPFEGTSAVNVFVAALKQPVTPPSRWAGDVTPALEAVCLQCLEKDPARRPQTAEALALDLERAVAAPDATPPRGRAALVITLCVGGLLAAVAAVMIVGHGDPAPVVSATVAPPRADVPGVVAPTEAPPPRPRPTEPTIRWSVAAGRNLSTVALRPPSWSEVATGDEVGSVTRWSTATGERLGALGPVGDGAMVAYSRDGAHLLASGRERTVLWDVDTGAVIAEYANDRILERPRAEWTQERTSRLAGHQLRTARFLADGRLLVTDLLRRPVVLDPLTLEPKELLPTISMLEVEYVDVSARGELLGTVLLSELRPGASPCLALATKDDLAPRTQLVQHEGQVLKPSDGRFCGERAVSGLWDLDGIFVWGPGGATVIPALDPSPRDGGVPRIAVAGQLVFGVSRGGSLLVWDLRRDACVFRRHEAHAPGPAAIAVTPDGACLVTAGTDGALRVWDLPPP